MLNELPHCNKALLAYANKGGLDQSEYVCKVD